MAEQGEVRSDIDQKSSHSVQEGSQLASFHLPLQLLFMEQICFLELLIFKLRRSLFRNKLLVIVVEIFILFFGAARSDALGFFGSVKEHFVLAFPCRFVDGERLHGGSVDQPF